MLCTNEFAWPDLIKLVLGHKMAMKNLWPEIFNTDFFKQVPQLKVSVYFLLGRHDNQVSSKLAAEYFGQLKTPKKEIIWFEYSGHNPMFEETKKFNDVIKNILTSLS